MTYSRLKKIIAILLAMILLSSPCAVLAQEANIIMVGDMLMHMPVNRAGEQPDGSRNFDFMFDYTRDIISHADLAMVNQEVVLGGPELKISGYPSFNTYTEVGDAIAKAGFDVVLHGTNHALDRGARGVTATLNYWRSKHPEIKILGMHDSQEDQDNLYIRDVNGIKVAIINCTYGTNGIPLPKGMPYAVDVLNETRLERDIAKAESMADFTIVTVHWGTEYRLTKDAMQTRWSDFFLRSGVDLVIGTHPHVIEPMEVLTREDGHEMLVYYSLGNYINATGAGGGQQIAHRMLGAMADVTIEKDKKGKTYIKEYTGIPLVTYISSDQKLIETKPLKLLTTEEAKRGRTVALDKNYNPIYLRQLWTKVMGLPVQ